MKNLIKMLLILALTLCCVFALASCEMIEGILANIPGFSTGDTNDGGEDEGEGNEDDGKVELEGLALIEGGKANFQIVQATTKGAPLRAKALYDRFKELGIELNAPISDSDAAKVTDCEIVIGADIKNREDKVISSRYLGSDGYQIKVVGNSVVIAGGSDKALTKAYEIFLSQILGINTKTKAGDIDNLAIKEDTEVLKLTDYLIDSIKVAGNDLSEYTLVIDVDKASGFEFPNIDGFREKLYTETGYWLDLGTADKLDTYKHKLVIRSVTELTNDNGEGFVAYVDAAGDLYFECAYANAFDKAFESSVKGCIFGKMNDVTISKNFKQTKRTAYVYYSDFGAVGNGKVDDFKALLAAHNFANECGQKVYGTEGAVYYIDTDFTEEIIVRTNVDLRGATVRVNDVGSVAYKYRRNALFHMARTHAVAGYDQKQLDETVGTDRYIAAGAANIAWLAPLITEDSMMVRLYNSNHRDFIRHGANQSSGNVRTDMILIDKDGNITADTLPIYEYTTVTTLNVWRIDDEPIVFENGNFENICCRTVEETGYICKFHEYYRGFKIYRTNTTLRNIKHTMIDEPDLNVTGTKNKVDEPKSMTTMYGTRDESYPYYGFFHVQTSYNTRGENLILDGHTTYYEDKPATASTGGVIPNPVAMGTYDIVIEYSTHTYLDNVVQQDNLGTGLADQRYWGIMSSNGVKNLFFDDCQINRFDAHRGFWNATLVNTTIGHSFNVIGGGELYCENVTKITGSAFIILRKDYGATFDGNVTLVNCTHKAYVAYHSARYPAGALDESNIESTSYIINADYSIENEGGVSYKKNPDGSDYIDPATGDRVIDKDGRYWSWDFGFTCYMPRTVTIENFKSGADKTYVFPALPDGVFTAVNQYQITNKIIFVGDGNQYGNCPVTDTSKKILGIERVHVATREDN